jgi:hypothetical protein
VASNLKINAMPTAALSAGALFLLASAAIAAPPQGRFQSRMQSQIQTPARHLDLRAPAHALEARNMAAKPDAFPSMTQHLNSAQEQPEFSNLGSVGMRARPAIQDFVRKVHREGLPVARLFETKSALLHIGLSPRGKPGLWLVQKTH